MQEDKREDDDYHDWVKSTLSLLYVKEAIADTVNENAIQLHQIIRSKVETTCKSAVQEVCKDCTSNDVREGEQENHRSSVYYINCQTNVCNHWLDAILNHHADLPKPLVEWGNINPTVWPKEPWEIAKVFMPIGCEKQRHAKDSDLNDLLTLLEKCTFFHKENFNKPLIQELKHFSNKVLHSESMKVMDQEMMEGLDRMIKFLEYQHYFNQVQSCKDAVEKIKQLKDNPIDDDLFAEYEQKARDYRSSVLADKQNRLQMDSDASHTRLKDLQDVPLKSTERVFKIKPKSLDHTRSVMYTRPIYDYMPRRIEQRLDEIGFVSYGISTMDTLNIKGEKNYMELLSEIKISTDRFQDLLHKKKLPKNEELRKALALYRTGLIERVKFDSMCDIICSHIKAKSTYIRFVRPSYTSKDPKKVVFVVMCEKSIQLQVDYNVKTHIIGSSSNEAKEIMYHMDEQFSLKESEILTSTIDKYAEELMRKHQNICMISSCLLKSTGHGTENASIIQKKCIVIYVDVKGFIPIHDEILPVSLKVPNSDQVIPIDVRESGYQSFYGAQEYHEKLKPGCMIRGTKFGGTLGGFIEKSGIMYALTSAHTFLTDDSYFQKCLSSNEPYRYSTDLQKVCVYQNEQNDEHKIGHIVYAAIDPGGDHRPGVDIAVIELTDTTRLPVSGQFPDGNTEHAGFTINEPMEYSSGLTYDLKSFTEQAGKSSEAYKFGSTTDCTKGSFVVLGACVRTMEYYDNLTFGKPLYKQYEVKSLGNPDTNPFADHGDSGALVFAKHDGNRSDLRAVGMVQGGTYHKTCVVTPIWAIFHNLGNNGLRFKDFRFNRQNIFGPEMPIVSQDDYSNDVWIHNRDREQDIAQDLSIHVREIKQDVTEKLKTLEEKTDAQNTEVSNKLGQLTEKLNCLEENTNEQTNGVMNKLDHIISYIRK